MAEFVEKIIQSTIPEMEEMERLSLLTKSEINALIKKRRQQEYRIVRRSKAKEDFMSSIIYEKKLLELLKIRRMQMQLFEKTREIEDVISLRVMKKCRYMTRYWPTHLDTWALRHELVLGLDWKSEGSIAYAEQVRFHAGLPSVYIAWAKYEVEQRNNFEVARTILLSKAPLYHEKSPLIKRELFRLELLYVEYLKNKEKEGKGLSEVIEENRSKILECEIPRAIFEDSVKAVPTPEMYLEFYEVADKFEFAHKLRDDIYNSLMEAFPNSEHMWKLKAKRKVLNIEPVENDEDNVTPVALLAIDKFSLIVKVFDEAINAVGPSFVIPYIDELLGMLYECWSNRELENAIMEKIVALCQNHSSSLMPIHYFVWFYILHKQCKAEDELESILEKALKAYPNIMPIQLQYIKYIMAQKNTETKKLQVFNQVATSATGIFGLKMWEEALTHLKSNKQKVELYMKGLHHSCDTITKGVRVKYIDWKKSRKGGIKVARKAYKDLCICPPFSAKLHAKMVIAELTEKDVNVDMIRKIFDTAIRQFGTKHPGVWLSFIQFEKSLGDPLKAGGLYTRAEKELEPRYLETFRELNITLRDTEQNEISTSEDNVWVSEGDVKEENDEAMQAIVNLYLESPMITYSVDQARKSFFSQINNMKKEIIKGIDKISNEDGKEWEGVLEHLLGKKICLSIHKFKVKWNKEDTNKVSLSAHPTKKVNYDLSDSLSAGLEESASKMKEANNIVDTILKSSKTLKPEFLQQTQLSPYFIGKYAAKKERRNERNKTKGAGWDNMKAPEMTEELKRDIEILQMRPVLDPKRPFKNRDMQVVPKYFQMGKIMDSPLDFYSSRIPKKDRKRTMAEEILNDEDALRYQKQKYNEIITEKQRFHPKKKKSKQAG